MRKVVYYRNEKYCEFPISDEAYSELTQQLVNAKFIKEDLGEATRTLEIAFSEGHRLGTMALEEPELIAACYIWWYFNDRIKKGPLIEGDVLLIDEEGDSPVTYTNLTDDDFQPNKPA